MNPLTQQPVLYFLQAHATQENVSFFEKYFVQTNFINILFALAVLIFIFKKFNVLSMLDKRQQQIVQDLTEAEEKRAKAMVELEALEKRAAQLTVEVDKIIQDAQQTAEMVGQTIVRNAEEEAAKLISNAQKRIALEQKTSARELENRLMKEAIHGARQLLESTLSNEDRHQSVEEFVDALPDLYRKELQR